MGLGKTLQSIVASIVGGFEKILILCPASLKINWRRELMDFVDEDDISIIYGSNWEPAKYTIINYDIIKNFHTIKKRGKEYEDWELRREIATEEYDLIICDEAHYLKNNTSQRTKIVLDLYKKFPPKSFWLLTGTPISNRPMDYYPLLTLVNSHLTKNWKFFAKRYCGAINFRKNGKMIWITDGASNLDELNEQTKGIVIRRKKEEVLDLPDKIVIPYYLELPDRDVYENVFNEYLEWAKLEGKRMGFGKHLVELTILRKFIAFEKVKFSMELIDTALDQNKKVIVFTNFKEELETFMNLLGKKAVCIHGGVKGDNRQAAVDNFQNNDDIKVLVGQVKAAGVGLTLTAAEVVIINSLDWVPGNLEQAEDRAYRMGQENNVTVYYPLFEDTVDTLVWKSLQRKKEIIDTIIGDETIINEILDNLEDHG
jgi:SWI/SNF-related matrix-associated actin-dependent regulator 1 of chromatin subfamily A